MTRGPWTEELENRLREMVAAKELSAADMADALGHGLSRSAVLGKMFRLGLEGRHYHHRSLSGTRTDNGIKMRLLRRREHRETVRVKASKPKPLPAAPAVLEMNPVHFFDRRANQCVFPLWSPEHSTGDCCGAKTWKGNYCEAHYQITHMEATQRDIDRIAHITMRNSFRVDNALLDAEARAA